MNGFLDTLEVKILSASDVKAAGSDVQLYRLTSPLRYHSDFLNHTIEVPAGVTTDFASIYRAAWEIIDPNDPCILYPSVVHDYLYQCAGLLPDGFTYDRETADHTLREAMESCGAGEIRNLVYQAVCAGGASHWKRAA